jgi:2'-5' RNA ligase
VAHLVSAVDAVRREAGEQRLRWAEPSRWHLTLAFYGEVPDRRVDDLAARLGRAAGRCTASLRLRFATGGRFGSRVLWVGVRGDLEPLTRLADSTVASGRRCGLDLDDRPYRPHLTVARAGPASRADLKPLAAALADYEGPLWAGDRLVLVRSHLGPRPRYDEQASWRLGEAP